MEEIDESVKGTLFSNNPFVNKQKKNNKNNIQSPIKQETQNESSKITEQKAAKFINAQNNSHAQQFNTSKKKKDSIKNSNNICLVSQSESKKKEDYLKGKKRTSIDKTMSPKMGDFKKENVHNLQSYATKSVLNIHKHKNEKEGNQKIHVTIKENLSKKREDHANKRNFTYNNNFDMINNLTERKSELISFKNDDEIIEYIKCKVKEGKIKNIAERLDLRSNDFTGFSLSKKDRGYIQYEIDIEDDLVKLNEIFKEQNVKINNKQIKIVYSEESDSSIKTKEVNNSSKQISTFNSKNEGEKSITEKQNVEKPKEEKPNLNIEKSTSKKAIADHSFGRNKNSEKPIINKQITEYTFVKRQNIEKQSAEKSNLEKSNREKSNAKKQNIETITAEKLSFDKLIERKPNADKSNAKKQNVETIGAEKLSLDKLIERKPNEDKSNVKKSFLEKKK